VKEALVEVGASDEPASDVGQPCESVLLKAKKLLEAYVKKYRYSSAFASSVAEVKDVLKKLERADVNKTAAGAEANKSNASSGLTAAKLVSVSLAEGVFPSVSEETRLKLTTALGKVGLATAMSTGDVWTAEDQTGLWSGCPTEGEGLEEHTSTGPDGERIIQGDIVVPSGSGSLVEVEYPGNAADYWLYNRSHSVVRWCPGPSTSAAAEAAFVNAAAHIEAQVPCVAFLRVERKDFSSCKELPSVMLTSEKTGCWSHLGQVSGNHNRGAARYKELSQRLNLGPGCELLGTAARQLMRTLGVRNELSRTDRDDFVSVFKDRANDGHANFALNAWPPPQAYKGHSFDLLSLMMPPARAFSSAGEVTVEPKGEPKLRHYLGQRMGLSQLDAERLAERYGCPDNARPVEPSAYITGQLLLGKNGKGMQKRCGDLEYTNFFAGQRDKPVSCADLLGACELDHDGAQVRKVCASTCMRCVPEPPGLFDEVAASTPRPTDGVEVLPAVTSCVDALDTGFAFASGAGKTCTELVGYCEDADIGSQVKVACPLTCGRCDLTGFGLSGRPFVGTAACADLPAYAPPHFKEAGGTVLDCSDLKDHCKNGEHTDYVSKKCPATCGICKELELNKKVDAEMAAAMAAKVTTITITTTTTTPMREIEFNLKDATERGTNTDGNATNNETATASSGQWCSRRRRWGYCYSRRRRLD